MIMIYFPATDGHLQLPKLVREFDCEDYAPEKNPEGNEMPPNRSDGGLFHGEDLWHFSKVSDR